MIWFLTTSLSTWCTLRQKITQSSPNLFLLFVPLHLQFPLSEKLFTHTPFQLDWLILMCPSRIYSESLLGSLSLGYSLVPSRIFFSSLVFLLCNPIISCAYLLTELFPLLLVVSLRVGIVPCSSLKSWILVQWLAKNKILDRWMVKRGDDIKYPKGVIHRQWKDRNGIWVSRLENVDLRVNCFR